MTETRQERKRKEKKGKIKMLWKDIYRSNNERESKKGEVITKFEERRGKEWRRKFKKA